MPQQATVINNDTLRITASKPAQPVGGKSYLSARLESKATFGPGQYYEARIDLPSGQRNVAGVLAQRQRRAMAARRRNRHYGEQGAIVRRCQQRISLSKESRSLLRSAFLCRPGLRALAGSKFSSGIPHLRRGLGKHATEVLCGQPSHLYSEREFGDVGRQFSHEEEHHS